MQATERPFEDSDWPLSTLVCHQEQREGWGIHRTDLGTLHAALNLRRALIL